MLKNASNQIQLCQTRWKSVWSVKIILIQYQRQCVQNIMCKGISDRFAQQKILRQEFSAIKPKINLQ